MLYQIAQEGKRLGPLGDALLPAPQLLVNEVKMKGMEKNQGVWLHCLLLLPTVPFLQNYTSNRSRGEHAPQPATKGPSVGQQCSAQEWVVWRGRRRELAGEKVNRDQEGWRSHVPSLSPLQRDSGQQEGKQEAELPPLPSPLRADIVLERPTLFVDRGLWAPARMRGGLRPLVRVDKGKVSREEKGGEAEHAHYQREPQDLIRGRTLHGRLFVPPLPALYTYSFIFLSRETLTVLRRAYLVEACA